MSVAGNIRAGAAYVELTLNDSVLSRGLRRAQARLKAFSASVSQMGQSMMRMSAVATAPLALSARTFMGFSDQMAEVRAVTGAAGDAFIAMSEKAKELGRTTSFTAKQVSEGMTELGRAGFKSEQILAAIPSVLNLARGTATDLGAGGCRAGLSGTHIRWDISDEHVADGCKFGVWYSSTTPVDTPGAPAASIPYTTGRGTYTVTRQQTEAEHMAVRALRGDDVCTVAKLSLPWDTEAHGSPPDQVWAR